MSSRFEYKNLDDIEGDLHWAKLEKKPHHSFGREQITVIYIFGYFEVWGAGCKYLLICGIRWYISIPMHKTMAKILQKAPASFYELIPAQS
jgi:hypothetical protein